MTVIWLLHDQTDIHVQLISSSTSGSRFMKLIRIAVGGARYDHDGFNRLNDLIGMQLDIRKRYANVSLDQAVEAE